MLECLYIKSAAELNGCLIFLNLISWYCVFENLYRSFWTMDIVSLADMFFFLKIRCAETSIYWEYRFLEKDN